MPKHRLSNSHWCRPYDSHFVVENIMPKKMQNNWLSQKTLKTDMYASSSFSIIKSTLPTVHWAGLESDNTYFRFHC